MINQIEHNEVKSSQISENEVVGSKDSSGTIIHIAEQTNSQRHQQQNEIKTTFCFGWMVVCCLWDVFEKLSEDQGSQME